MSNAKSIVLRIQTSEGTKRINVNLGDSLTSVYEKVFAEFSLPSFNFSLFRHRNGSSPVESLKSETVASIGLKHGDILYLQPVDGATLFPQAATAHSTPGTSGSSTSQSTPSSGDPGFEPPAGTNNSRGASTSFVEDEVDKILSATEGKIMRKKDPKLCHHSANGCCIHCSPLEPYDEAYLREQNIKHLSFHSYLRKLTGGMDKGKFVALENTSCRIKPGCKDHPPWPKGICSKCQPSAVTLNRQSYRHVDNVMFENPQIVERFLEYWRISGHQRVGYLYGKYEVHADVPLGIRATVAAIYEPPQESTKDKITLLPDERENLVNELAQQLGLQKVGWIFTDLIADDVSKGTVKHVRNINTHFLSAQECITAGYLQNLHPNPCKFSSTGHFGSKFTTVCVTGDSSKQVHMEGYAVSSQCMSLVRDHCLIPTKDMPQLGYVPESTDKQYVPDVYYKVSGRR
ncbi:Nuclear protein localization [Nesidiocoris tenuis]|uniref:Nuclear protein localization n=1 Tax=Nesidiocoris tenuis TaxID=355587 RepID=A0ABN7BED5_9HEMI|nr:Nuclear protein localization [Nesidiocoris tenuis]